MINASTNIEEIKAKILERFSILAQEFQGVDRDNLDLEVQRQNLEMRRVINIASKGQLEEFDVALLTWVIAPNTDWDDTISLMWDGVTSLLKQLNDLVRESKSLDETPNPEKPKCFGFAAIAAKVADEIAAKEAKRDKDRRFVREIVNEVSRDHGLSEISYNGMYDEDVRAGLDALTFRNITQFIIRDIEALINPRLEESRTLQEYYDLLNKTYEASSGTGISPYDSRWTEYLKEFCPDAMKHLEDSSCQFKAECKRSLTFIALRLELEALKAAFPAAANPDPDDDLY